MGRLNSTQIVRVANAQALAQKAAEVFQQTAQESIVARGRFTVALSGGSTPKAMFARLAGAAFRSAIDWEHVYIFWGDERCVPPDDVDSNFRMTNEALLSQVPLPSSNIFRIHGEDQPSQAAQQYATQIRQFFQSEAMPQFDLVFLGMGADGHTASLFPGTAALYAGAAELVVENYVEKLAAHRVTLTAATINHARAIVFLVGGADKSIPLKAVLHGAYQPELYPSQLIQPTNGTLTWIVDDAAAASLMDAPDA